MDAHPIAILIMNAKTDACGNLVFNMEELEDNVEYDLTFMEIAHSYNGSFWQDKLGGTSVFDEYFEGGDDEMFSEKIINDYRKIYRRYGAEYL
jgi:hypothetical protein